MLDLTAWSSVILGIQWPRKLEKTSENPQAIPLRPLTVSLSATSPWFLNTSWENDHTTTLGSLCQCMTALSEKKLFLISQIPIALFEHLRHAHSSIGFPM